METANPYFKVNKYEYLNQDRIEAVCAYLHSRPLVRYAKQMEEDGMCKKMQLRHQIKSIIFYDNGEIFLCPYSPETYMKRVDESCFTISAPKKSISGQTMYWKSPPVSMQNSIFNISKVTKLYDDMTAFPYVFML